MKEQNIKFKKKIKKICLMFHAQELKIDGVKYNPPKQKGDKC